MVGQAILYREKPTPYTAVIHEAALRMGVGGTATSRAQRDHLVSMSEREGITVLVVPFGATAFPGSGQGVDQAHGPVPQLDTVLIDSNHGVEFLDSEAQLAKYRTLLDRMEASALNPSESRAFLRRVAESG
ncbi:hypothetical protein AQ490_02610 [Wenjunlia vitaminophila]|uniref:DUF5753 domain-containing protein n=2 Tax=Wenjunlia vitaminophila TaxID=76728 RepID=A0A0T6LYK5_WENVI|nr:hypothetical protein AQ490_02610 [Wenjunlia vitaminophila]